MKIFIEQKSKNRTLFITEAFVTRIVRFIIGTYLPAKKNYHVNIFFVNPAKMRQLNKKFFRRSYATDVISLPLEKESLLSEVLLGDVFICGETAMRQAKEYGHSYKEEVALLVAHGMLHLLGYDDTTSGKRKIMQQEEQKILKACGQWST